MKGARLPDAVRHGLAYLRSHAEYVRGSAARPDVDAVLEDLSATSAWIEEQLRADQARARQEQQAAEWSAARDAARVAVTRIRSASATRGEGTMNYYAKKRDLVRAVQWRGEVTPELRDLRDLKRLLADNTWIAAQAECRRIKKKVEDLL